MDSSLAPGRSVPSKRRRRPRGAAPSSMRASAGRARAARQGDARQRGELRGAGGRQARSAAAASSAAMWLRAAYGDGEQTWLGEFSSARCGDGAGGEALSRRTCAAGRAMPSAGRQADMPTPARIFLNLSEVKHGCVQAVHGVDATAVYASLSNPCQDRAVQPSGSEWLLSTLFDASLLTPEPPFGGSFFMRGSLNGTHRAWR